MTDTALVHSGSGARRVPAGHTKWFALALLCAVQFMVVLDVAIVNVALPSIQLDLGFSQENLQWVISAYALVFGGFLLLGGRLADILGRRGVFMAGLVVFSIGSLLCGLAWSEASLIGARALQGLGAAAITPSALSILTTMFTRNVHLDVDRVLLGSPELAPLNRFTGGDVYDFGPVSLVVMSAVLVLNAAFVAVFFKELKPVV